MSRVSILEEVDWQKHSAYFKQLSVTPNGGESEVRALREERDALQAGLKKFGIRMPSHQVQVHRARIREIDRQLAALERLAEVIQRGFDPFTPPANWFGGYVARNEIKTSSSLRLLFNAPVPEEVWPRFEAAKRTRLFDLFLVFSPYRENFVEITRPAPPPTVRKDPVLVGYVRNGTEAFSVRAVNGFALVAGAEGFLIALWDPSIDLHHIITSTA